MPQYLRRRRAWWETLTPAEVRHLPAAIHQLLRCAARQMAWRDPLVIGLQITTSLVGVGGLVVRYMPDMAAYVEIPFAEVPFQIPLFMVAVGAHFFRYQSVFRKALRIQMLAQGIRPAVCFECRYFTEGFEGSECPVCGAILYQDKTAPPA